MTPPPDTNRPRLGRYEIVARLAVGGMAEVFLARERGPAGLERVVVVKRILPHLAADAELVELFLQEARVIAGLHHPAIVQIYELGEQDGTWFIAMEYVPGVTLKQLATAAARLKHPLPIAVAMGLVMQACEGAHAAHELTDPTGRPLGLVHRDISPHNLMVTDDGHVKLLDFGIAKATADGEATRTGGVKGKTSYLSPEQCRQEPLDRRSDVFALGIVLWELVAGVSLFKRESEYETLQAIDHGNVRDIRLYRDFVPVPLIEVLHKALAQNRDERYASADALRQALAKVAQELGLDVGIDAVRAFVGEVVGDRRREERTALEKAFSGAEPLAPRIGARMAGQNTDEGPSIASLQRRVMKEKKRRRKILAAVASVLVLALAGTFLGLRLKRPSVSGAPLVVGFPPTLGSAVMSAEIEPLRTYLEARTGRPIEFVFGKTYEDLADKLVAGDVSFAMLTPYLFLKTRGREPKITPLATDLFDGTAGNTGVVLVNDQSTANALGDLKGLRFCLTDPDSTTGYILPRAALRQAGLDPDKDVTTVMSGNHTQAMKDLIAGNCDAAGTYDKAVLTAERSGVPVARMHQLVTTGRAPNETFVASTRTSDKEREAMKKALLEFQPQRDIGQPYLGEVQRISGFAPFDEAAFEKLRKAIEAAR